mmetsp:Transcript_2853/g.7248  ORF Transcript_2853/g.7248 Transcript_2853/m.7248 type:complete len:178 (-) Transcript_2853:7-540(-)
MYSTGGGRLVHGGAVPVDFQAQIQGGVHMSQAMEHARDVDMRRLEAEVRTSRMEEERLRAAVISHENAIQQNEGELRAFREATARRDEEMRRLRNEESYRLQVVMEEYRNRFERERTRLGLALQKTDACTKIISEVLPECIECERALMGGNVPYMAKSHERSLIEGSFQNKTQMMLS